MTIKPIQIIYPTVAITVMATLIFAALSFNTTKNIDMTILGQHIKINAGSSEIVVDTGNADKCWEMLPKIFEQGKDSCE